MRPRSLSLSEPCSLLTQSRRQSCHGSDTTRWRSPLLQPFNLLDRQIAVLRRDPCISPSSDGQLLHHEINGSAQRPKMSCVAVPVRRSLRNLICRYPVYVGRKIKFHHRVLSVAGYVAAVRLRLASQAGCSAHQATVAENSRGIPLGLAPGIALAWGDVA
jgi:hypothetical protein